MQTCFADHTVGLQFFRLDRIKNRINLLSVEDRDAMHSILAEHIVICQITIVHMVIRLRPAGYMYVCIIYMAHMCANLALLKGARTHATFAKVNDT